MISVCGVCFLTFECGIVWTLFTQTIFFLPSRYRDDVQPQAHIVHFPADMGSDTIISFGADELFVLYEAKFTQGDDEEDVIRDWHTITNPYDTKGINGKRKTRVMVRNIKWK